MRGVRVKEPTVSLRSTLAAVTTVFAILCAVNSAALILLTEHLHRGSALLRSSVNSVRFAEEAQLSLLLYDRTSDPELRRDRVADLHRDLKLAYTHVSSEEEGRILRDAEVQVKVYLAAAEAERPASELEGLAKTATDALDALSTNNLAQAETAMREAARLDRGATVLGAVTAILALVTGGFLLWWLRERAFQPVFDLAAVMGRFGQGERDARAVEAGPAELRAMAAGFNAMASALAEHRKARIAFVAGVAHDLRNPLSVLVTSLDLVSEGRPLPPEPRLRSLFERMRRQVSRMERMTEDFLDLSRSEAGHLDLRLQTADAGELARSAAALFDAAAPRHRIEIALPEERALLRCDPFRVEQVLMNLIGNALKYSPDGGAVEVTVAREGGEVVFSVADSGIGMSEDERRHIFDPFRRAESAAQRFPGVGLGLSVVKRIIEAHSGTIEVDSAPGSGSRFRVRLPCLGSATDDA